MVHTDGRKCSTTLPKANAALASAWDKGEEAIPQQAIAAAVWLLEALCR
jgi:hypothetical protein